MEVTTIPLPKIGRAFCPHKARLEIHILILEFLRVVH